MGLERKSMNKYRLPHEAFWGILAQGVGFLLAPFFWLCGMKEIQAVSFGLGYLICLLPNCVFYVLFFRYQGAQHSTTIRNRFYFGEMVKLIMVAGMFAMVWQIPWIKPSWVFSGYGMSWICFFLPPIVISSKQTTMSPKRESNELK